MSRDAILVVLTPDCLASVFLTLDCRRSPPTTFRKVT